MDYETGLRILEQLERIDSKLAGLSRLESIDQRLEAIEKELKVVSEATVNTATDVEALRTRLFETADRDGARIRTIERRLEVVGSQNGE